MTDDTRRLDWLSAWLHGDTGICPPGEHGGGSDEWLLYHEDRRVPKRGYIETKEYKGKSLREAIDTALAAAQMEPPKT